MSTPAVTVTIEARDCRIHPAARHLHLAICPHCRFPMDEQLLMTCACGQMAPRWTCVQNWLTQALAASTGGA